MAKKITIPALVLCAVLLLQTPVMAFTSWGNNADGSYAGFWGPNSYTSTTPEYYFMTDEAVLIYNKEAKENPDYFDIWTGSSLYVPIYAYDYDKDTDNIATSKNIKDDNLEISYKVTSGADYIGAVSIVDGKKEKQTGLSSGAYVKIEFTEKYTGVNYAAIKVVLVLSVNRVSYQETRVELEARLRNRLEYIDRNSVYGAQVPTRFSVSLAYNGEATFDMGGGIKYTAYVSSSQKYVISYSGTSNVDVELMYPNAHLQFLNFMGDEDTFASTGRLQIPIDTKAFQNKDAGAPRVYAYEILAGNQLRSLGSDVASYDSGKKILTIRTKTLGSYVLSNQALKQEVDEETNEVFQSGYLQEEPEQATPMQSIQIQDTDQEPIDFDNIGDLPDQEEATVTVINADNSSGSNPPTGQGPAGTGALFAAGMVSLAGMFSAGYLKKNK